MHPPFTLHGLRSDLTTCIGFPIIDRLGRPRLHPATGLFADIARLGDELEEWRRRCPPSARASGSSEPHIVFVDLKPSWTGNVAWEVTLALALAMRGARCRFVLQGEPPPVCDQHWYRHRGPTRRRAVRSHGQRLARSLPFPVDRIDHPRPSAEQQRLEDEAACVLECILTLEDQQHADSAGAPDSIHPSISPPTSSTERWLRVVTPSLRRFYRRSRLPRTRSALRVRTGFLAAALHIDRCLPDLLQRLRPDAVVAVNGAFCGERLLYERCLETKTPIYLYEAGYHPGHLRFARNQEVAGATPPLAWKTRRHRPLDDNERDNVTRVMAARMDGRLTARYWKQESSTDRLRERAGIRPSRPHLTLFTNVVWDSAVQFREIFFRDLIDWLDRTIRWFAGTAGESSGLTIRVHPAERTAPAGPTVEPVMDHLRSRFPRPPDNVRFIGPEESVNSYQLIDESTAVGVYTSTVGLESALRGKPTIVAARTHYRGQGFTLDPADQQEYIGLLQQLGSGRALPGPDQDLVLRYCHAFFLESQIPFPFTGASRPGAFDRLSFRLEDLAPGSHEGLDAICDAIFEGRTPILARAAAEGGA